MVISFRDPRHRGAACGEPGENRQLVFLRLVADRRADVSREQHAGVAQQHFLEHGTIAPHAAEGRDSDTYRKDCEEELDLGRA